MSAFVPLGFDVVSGFVSRDCNDMCRICRGVTFIFSMMFPDVDDL